ncbi:hypothetical protein Tco_0232904 [Tanacetum coccineum]
MLTVSTELGAGAPSYTSDCQIGEWFARLSIAYGEDFILHYLPDLGEITNAFENLIMNEIFESAFDKKFPGLQYYRFLNEVLINCTSMKDEIAFDEIAGYFFLEEVNLPGYIVSIGPGDSTPLSLYNNIFHLKIERNKDVVGCEEYTNIILANKKEDPSFLASPVVLLAFLSIPRGLQFSLGLFFVGAGKANPWETAKLHKVFQCR